MPVHPAQGCIAAALQRKVELRADLRQCRHPGDVLAGEQFRLQGAEPDPFDPIHSRCGFDRVDQPQPQLLAIAGKVDPDQHSLPVTGSSKRLQLVPQVFRRLGPHRPARSWNDAVGTVPLASVLNLDKRPGPFGEAARLHPFKPFPALVRLNFDDPFPGRQRACNQFDQPAPPACACDHVRFGETLGGIGERLRETARKHHLGGGVAGLELAKHLPGFPVAGGGDCAGIDHVDIRQVGMGYHIIAIRSKNLGQNLCFILVDLAAQGVESNPHLYTPSKFDCFLLCNYYKFIFGKLGILRPL